MSRTLTASDRNALIRLASELPKGSPERRAILVGLQKVDRTASDDPYSAEALRKKHRGFPVTVEEFKRKYPKLTVEMYDGKISDPTPEHKDYLGTFYLWDIIRHNIEAAGMSTDENSEDFESVFFFAEHPALSSLVKLRVGQTAHVFEGSGGWWSYRRAKDGTGKRIR